MISIGQVKKSSAKLESFMHMSTISYSMSVVNDKVVSLAVCISAMTKVNNSIDAFNIERVKLMIHCQKIVG